MSKALRILGIVYLIVAIIIAVAIICSNGTASDGTFYVDTETNLIAIGCSLGIIFQGILVYCGAGGLAQVIDRCEEFAIKFDITDKTTKENFLETKEEETNKQ